MRITKENEIKLKIFNGMQKKKKLANLANLAFTIGQLEAESVFSSVNFLIPNARTTSGFESTLSLPPSLEWNKVVQVGGEGRRRPSLLACGA